LELAFEATGKQALVVLVLPVHRNVTCGAHDGSGERVGEEDIFDLRLTMEGKIYG
jgi:hypothetical protein